MSVQTVIDIGQTIAAISCVVFLMVNCLYNDIEFSAMPKLAKYVICFSLYFFVAGITISFVGWLWT